MTPMVPPPSADEMCAAEGLLMLVHPLHPSSSSSEPPSKVRIKKIKESPRSPTSTLPHACNLCSMSFNSPQALGGHKTPHRPQSTVSGGTSDQVFECLTCHAQFPSGQALGGHQRKHYPGLIGAPGKIKRLKYSDVPVEDGAPRHARMILDIDLNEPYMPNGNVIEIL